VAGALTGTPRIIRVLSAPSTMDLLHEVAGDGGETGTVVVAGEQTGGRGSRGRTWRSPAGGLWLSVLFRPRGVAGVELVGLRTALAVAEAIESLGPGVAVAIKWPNDLMVEDRKLGGILCEARWQGESPAWVVAGVGINVANRVPDELRDVAITLGDRLPGVTPELLEPEVIRRLRGLAPATERLDAGELALLRRRDWLAGRTLRGPTPGTAAGISEDGALMVRPPEGDLVAIRAGTVELADGPSAP
jgi:BirA family transcriptional regulator, biotin operon repressor / biotin---[acetyl-CoA-carboxylase] ligase